jgi:hypothetical protein
MLSPKGEKATVFLRLNLGYGAAVELTETEIN